MRRSKDQFAVAAIEPIPSAAPVDAVVVSFSRQPDSVILQSVQFSPDQGRYSVVAARPVEIVQVSSQAAADPIDALSDRDRRYPRVAPSTPTLPFAGGWIGFVAYEAGLRGERVLPRRIPDLGQPLLRFGLYDAAAVYDHLDRRWFAVAVDWPRGAGIIRPPVRERLESIRTRVESAKPPAVPTTSAVRDGAMVDAIPNMTPEAYRERVARCSRYIEAGDVYQVNLTQRFAVPTSASPMENYRRLRAANPAPFAAMLTYDGCAILSASPELFLRLDRGVVTTRPIKGTRPRVGVAERDEAAIRSLCASEKERAELTMIVDLLRNDIGRVCAPGSVRVVEAARIEEHPTVFHRVATIRGELRPDCGPMDLLRATLPGGSVTGAPKIRAMQIIQELEPTPRGVYCGSIGWIGLDGALSFSLAIRTMVQTANQVFVYAGGAVVADSDPQQEYDEIIAKATGMFRALRCRAPNEAPDLQEAPA